MKQTCFSYFLCRFKIKVSAMHEHVMNNQEHYAYEHLRTFKHIQGI